MLRALLAILTWFSSKRLLMVAIPLMVKCGRGDMIHLLVIYAIMIMTRIFSSMMKLGFHWCFARHMAALLLSIGDCRHAAGRGIEALSSHRRRLDDLTDRGSIKFSALSAQDSQNISCGASLVLVISAQIITRLRILQSRCHTTNKAKTVTQYRESEIFW